MTDLGIYEARDLAKNRPLWRLMSLHIATHSKWCMLLLGGLFDPLKLPVQLAVSVYVTVGCPSVRLSVDR